MDLLYRNIFSFLSCSKEPGQIGAGNSLYFDGDTNYFNISDTPILNAIAGAITLEASIKPKKQYLSQKTNLTSSCKLLI